MVRGIWRLSGRAAVCYSRNKFGVYLVNIGLRPTVTLIGRRPSVAVVAILLVLGFIDAWAGRRSYVAGDSISYLDMASGIARGDFDYAVNGHFSPLYPTILSVFLRPFQSDSVIEFAVVRMANFLIFAFAILVFQTFLSRFLDQYYRQFGPTAESSPAMSRSQFTIVSYVILAWSCFSLTMVSRVNPDMCVIGTTFAAAAILLSFRDGQVSRARFVMFGAVLGLGYLFKAIFFFALSAKLMFHISFEHSNHKKKNYV